MQEDVCPGWQLSELLWLQRLDTLPNEPIICSRRVVGGGVCIATGGWFGSAAMRQPLNRSDRYTNPLLGSCRPPKDPRRGASRSCKITKSWFSCLLYLEGTQRKRHVADFMLFILSVSAWGLHFQNKSSSSFPPSPLGGSSVFPMRLSKWLPAPKLLIQSHSQFNRNCNLKQKTSIFYQLLILFEYIDLFSVSPRCLPAPC